METQGKVLICAENANADERPSIRFGNLIVLVRDPLISVLDKDGARQWDEPAVQVVGRNGIPLRIVDVL